MITFNTQEEFDKAVMDALHKYLKVNVYLGRMFDELSVRVSVYDTSFRTEIDSDRDSVTVGKLED